MRDWRQPPPPTWFWRHVRDKASPPIVAEETCTGMWSLYCGRRHLGLVRNREIARKLATDLADCPTPKKIQMKIICQVCGEETETKSRFRRTCGDRCRQRLHRAGTMDLETLLARWKRQIAAERQSRERLVAAGVDLEAVR